MLTISKKILIQTMSKFALCHHSSLCVAATSLRSINKKILVNNHANAICLTDRQELSCQASYVTRLTSHGSSVTTAVLQSLQISCKQNFR